MICVGVLEPSRDVQRSYKLYIALTIDPDLFINRSCTVQALAMAITLFLCADALECSQIEGNAGRLDTMYSGLSLSLH